MGLTGDSGPSDQPDRPPPKPADSTNQTSRDSGSGQLDFASIYAPKPGAGTDSSGGSRASDSSAATASDTKSSSPSPVADKTSWADQTMNQKIEGGDNRGIDQIMKADTGLDKPPANTQDYKSQLDTQNRSTAVARSEEHT